MSYADSLLAKGEHVVYRARQHWLAPVADARNGLLLFLGSLALSFVKVAILKDFLGSLLWWPILLLFVIGLGWILLVYFTWRAQEYVITNRRVLKVEGLINKKSADSSLEKINDALLNQSFIGRIFRFGDLDIMTAADEAIDRYWMLNDAVGFKKAMLNAKNELEDGSARRAASEDAAPSARASAASASSASKASAPGDVTATLAKLADLRDRGAITPAEYEAKKADLLNRL